MKHIDNITLLVLSGALAGLMYIGIPKPWGIVVAILVVLFAIMHPLIQSVLRRKHPGFRIRFSIPVLSYLFLVILGSLLAIFDRNTLLTPVYIMFVLGGVLGIISWIARKGYRKPIKQLWKEDLFIVSWEAELVILLVFFFGTLRRHESFTWSSIAIMALALLDIVNQMIMKKEPDSTSLS